MKERLRRVLAIALLLGVAALAVVAALPRAVPPDDVGARVTPTPTAAACYPRPGGAPEDPGRSAWFTLRERLGSDGALNGYVARLGTAGSTAMTAVELPPEAFASGPLGEVVLVGSDDGSESTLRLVAPRGCTRAVATASTILRRATVDVTHGQLITFRLNRADRGDLGVWTQALDGTDEAVPLLPPLDLSDEALARFGPTFSTELLWSPDGDRLVVQSCGESQCRFRVVRPTTGETWTRDENGIGEALGLAGDRLVAFAACGGRPCPILAIDLASGEHEVLLESSGAAAMVQMTPGAVLVAERIDGLAIHDLATGMVRTISLPAVLAGVRLAAPGRSGATALPPGWIALAPDGAVPEPLRGGRLFAFDLATSRLVTLFGGDR